MRHLYKLALLLVLTAGFAMAQTGMQRPPTTPPTFPSQQQQQPPSTLPTPDENTGQAGAASTTAITKAESDIQTALRRQMPATADSVTVSTTDDHKLQLNGTVTSLTEKTQVEQVARTAAPGQEIVNKLNVTNAPVGLPSAPSSTNPAGTTNPPPTGNRPGETVPPTRPMPPMGSSFMTQQGSASQYPSTQSPSTKQPPTTNPDAQLPGNPNASAAATGNTGDVQSNIQKALQQDPTLANANISVNVTGNKVELTGTVPKKDEKNTAKQIAKSNANGMKVVDKIKVEHSKAGKDNTPPSKY